MSSVRYKARQIRLRSVSVALSVLVPFAIGSPCRLSAQDPAASAEQYSVRRMADGKQWTTLNLNVNIVPSWCYNDSEANCLRYGRLYTWESARRACESLRDGWRLPTEDEWRQLAKHYGGITTIPKIAVKRRTGHSLPEGTRDSMSCSVAADPEMASMRGCRLMDSSGQPPRMVRLARSTTISVRARKDSIVRAMGRRPVPFLFGASETDQTAL